MKYSRFLVLLGLMVVLVTAGCGGGSSGGGLNLNGSLTVTSTTSNQSSYVAIAFTTSYTNPQKADLLGVPLNFTTSIDSFPIGSYTMNTNNSGTIIQTFWVARTDTDQFFTLAATTGDLKASQTVLVPKIASTPLTFAPSASVLFTNVSTASGRNSKGLSQTLTISGGTSPYTVFSINPSPNPAINATIIGNSLTVAKISSLSGGNATITVNDSSLTPVAGTVAVSY